MWFYRSGLNILSSCLLSKNIRTKIYRITIFHIISHGCMTWYLALREVHGLRVLENRVLREIFGPTRAEGT